MKNRMLNRLLSPFLLLLLSAAILSGCREQSVKEPSVSAQNTAAGEQSAETVPEESISFVKDDLPADLDFDGRIVTWFIGDYMNAYWDEFYSEEQNGSRINDAVWQCRTNVEERLNVKFDYYRKQVVYNDRNDIKKLISASVMAGDNAYDVYAGRSLIDLVAEDKSFFHELSSLEYIDITKPWWNQSVIDMMPGKDVYALTGDGTLSLMKHAFCVFFNQTMLQAFDDSVDLYELVRTGRWTIEKIKQYAEMAYSDVNGNSEADYGDNFGLTFGDTNKYLGFQMAFGGVTVLKGSNGYEMHIEDEAMVNAYDAAYALVHETKGVLRPGSNTADNPLAVEAFGGNYADKTFMSGNALFTMSLVGDASTLIGDASFDYGMIPYPKYDEKQENYVTGNQRQAYFAILGYADAELSAAVLEAWSSECYRSLQPEYFEINLKTRYAADEDMAEMFDLIRSTIKVDVSNFFGNIVDSMVNPMKTLIVDKKQGQWSSEIAKSMGKWETKFAEIWDVFS
ncbi:MAG: hypothetical protein J5933_06635 [Clostridia bacterium]|nr:hypothetical protein [Clostridia bacterium]